MAIDDAFTAQYGQRITPPAGQLLLVNDSSPNAAPQLQVTSYGPLSDPSAGALAGSPDGNFTFTPASGWWGTVTFVYTMTDKDTGLTDTATASITVETPPPPAAADDAYACPFGQVCSVGAALGVLANDSSPANLALAVVGAPTPSEGTVLVNANGSFDWMPPNA